MSSEPQHRIDPAQPHFYGPAGAAPIAADLGQPPIDSGRGRGPEAWLRLHASDLIEHLQRWACELDAREAQLNARASQQDQRERAFRLQAQHTLIERAEQEQSLERRRGQLESQARRLAFRNR